MSTFSKEMAERLIAGGGWLPEHTDHDAPDNPQASRIVEYVDQGGKVAYGVTFVGIGNEYKYETESPFIGSPRVIWTAEDGRLP